jgi:hypothetical protein
MSYKVLLKELKWNPVFYNGIETNIEAAKDGSLRRVRKEWNVGYRFEYGEVDFSKLKLHCNGYRFIRIQIKDSAPKTVCVQQLIAAAFLDYKFQGNKLVIDHIDSNKLNNNLDNLKLVTHRQNLSKERTKKSGLPTGVSFDSGCKKYRASIRINSKALFLGLFNTPKKASEAYKNKLKEIYDANL